MAIGFGSLIVNQTGMRVNEKALETISHNIANLNTKGYARQQSIMQSNAYMKIGESMELGIGSSLQETRQIRNQFLDEIYRTEFSEFQYWETKKEVLQDLEILMAEPTWNGIQDVSNSFWQSWQELSKEPSNLGVRSIVRQRGEDLAGQLNYLGEQFYLMQQDLDLRITNAVTEINQKTQKIAMLNQEILNAETAGEYANDFRDQRNLLIDELNGYMDIKASEASDGQVDITVSGYLIVSKTKSFNMVAVNSVETGTFHDVKVEYSSKKIDIQGGVMQGLLDTRGKVLGFDKSISNGYPNSRADITFVVDVSEYEHDDHLRKFQASIETYLHEMNRRGIDYNLRLVAYNGSEPVAEYSFEKDQDAFIQQLRGLTPGMETVEGLSADDLTTMVAGSNRFRSEINPYVFLFSQGELSNIEEMIDFERVQLEHAKHPVNFMLMSNDPAKTFDPMSDIIQKAWTMGDDMNAFMEDLSNYIHEDINEKIASLDIQDDTLPFMLKSLNAFSNILLREVNYLHTMGAVTREDVKNMAFFVPIDDSRPLEMGNIAINPQFVDLANLASTGRTLEDNEVSLSISNLTRKEIFKLPGRSMSSGEFYETFMMYLGVLSGDADRLYQNQKSLKEYAESNRQTTMGVSLDEEMSLVLKYKFAYNASSKAFGLVNEMLDIVINRMGRVGR